MYILCRKLNFEFTENKKDLLLRSGMIKIIDTKILMEEASKLKCKYPIALGKYPIALADCYTLALAKLFNCIALFAKEESEIKSIIEKKSLKIPVVFLEKL